MPHDTVKPQEQLNAPYRTVVYMQLQASKCALHKVPKVQLAHKMVPVTESPQHIKLHPQQNCMVALLHHNGASMINTVARYTFDNDHLLAVMRYSYRQ